MISFITDFQGPSTNIPRILFIELLVTVIPSITTLLAVILITLYLASAPTIVLSLGSAAPVYATFPKPVLLRPLASIPY